MEPYRFSDFPGRTGVKTSGRGEWLSESGSLYPTLDIANLVDVISENIRTKASTMTGYKDRDAQVPQLLRLFRLNGGAGPTVSYEEFVNTLAKMNVSLAMRARLVYGSEMDVWSGAPCGRLGNLA
jgi:hypothetical protein